MARFFRSKALSALALSLPLGVAVWMSLSVDHGAAVSIESVASAWGDDPRWAEPDWDDSNGFAFAGDDESSGAQPLPAHWTRIRVEVREPRDDRFRVIQARGMQRVEIHWDGDRLEGRVMLEHPREEWPEAFRVTEFQVPQRAFTEGPHLVAVRYPGVRSRPPIQTDIRFSRDVSGSYPEPGSIRLFVGDHPDFSRAAIDDSEWERPGFDSFLFSPDGLAGVPRDVFWVRMAIVITRTFEPGTAGVLFESIKGAREIYWDGERIGSSGLVADSGKTEVPGAVHAWHVIPESLLSPGPHQLALRISSRSAKLPVEPLIDDLVVMDNLSSHKSIRAVQAIEEVGAAEDAGLYPKLLRNLLRKAHEPLNEG